MGNRLEGKVGLRKHQVAILPEIPEGERGQGGFQSPYKPNGRKAQWLTKKPVALGREAQNSGEKAKRRKRGASTVEATEVGATVLREKGHLEKRKGFAGLRNRWGCVPELGEGKATSNGRKQSKPVGWL